MKPYYEQDGITIYHGDCREILPTLPKVDLVLTDPPYGIDLEDHHFGKKGEARRVDIKGDKDQSSGQHVLDWATDAGIPIIAFASPWKPWPGDWSSLIVWDKGGAVGGGGDIRRCLKRTWELIQVRGNGPMPGARVESVWRFAVTPDNSAYHVAAKPTSLISALLVQFGGQTVLDPFMGSGSTLVSCKRLGRRAIGIEIEEGYCEIAAKRLAQGVLWGAE